MERLPTTIAPLRSPYAAKPVKLCNRERMRTLRPVNCLHVPYRPSLLRLLLLLWLALAVLMQPAFAAVCDVNDVRLALAGAVEPAVDAETDRESQQECCANPACGDCCLTATATLPATVSALLARPAATPPRPRGDVFVPFPVSVDDRPPIRI